MVSFIDDVTNFLIGTEFSTILREGKLVRPENPLDQETKWVSKDGTISIPSYQVAGEMEEIGAELAVLQLRKCAFIFCKKLDQTILYVWGRP